MNRVSRRGAVVTAHTAHAQRGHSCGRVCGNQSLWQTSFVRGRIFKTRRVRAISWLVGRSVPSFVPSFVCSFVRSFVCSFVCSFVPSFLPLFVCSFLRSVVPSSVLLQQTGRRRRWGKGKVGTRCLFLAVFVYRKHGPHTFNFPASGFVCPPGLIGRRVIPQ